MPGLERPAADTSLPPTLKEWAASVYQQLAPEDLQDYVPIASAGPVGDASPLRGQAAYGGSKRMLVLMSIVTVSLLIWYVATPG